MGDPAAISASTAPPSFFACYLLCSLNPRFKGRTYIGFTVNPKRRIRQHNGEITCGARKTQKRRPWEMILCVHGFPSHVHALQFEWAWQHPLKSLAVRDAAKQLKRQGARGQVLLLFTMLNLPEWNSMNLAVNFLSTKHQPLTKGCPCLPVQMQVKVGPLDDLPCYRYPHSELFDSDVSESGSDEDLPAVDRIGTFVSRSGAPDVSPLRSSAHDEDLPTNVNTCFALDVSPLCSPTDDDFPAVQSRRNLSGLLDVSPLPLITNSEHCADIQSKGNTGAALSTVLCKGNRKGNRSIVLDVSHLQLPEDEALPACQSNPAAINTGIVWDVSPLQSPCKSDAHTSFKESLPTTSPEFSTPPAVVAEKENESSKKLCVPALNAFQFTPLWSPSPEPAEQDGVGSIRNADTLPFQFMEVNSSFNLSPLSCVPIAKPTGVCLKAGLPHAMAGGACNAVEIIDLTDSPAYDSYPIKKFTFV